MYLLGIRRCFKLNSSFELFLQLVRNKKEFTTFVGSPRFLWSLNTRFDLTKHADSELGLCYYSIRNLSSLPKSGEEHVEIDQPIGEKSSPNSSLKHQHPNFDDGEEAFRSKTNTDLLRALVVYQTCGINVIVENNNKIMKFARAVLGRRLFDISMRSTFYGQFVGGDTIKNVEPLVVKNQRYGVKSILDYSVEHDITEQQAKDYADTSFYPDKPPTEEKGPNAKYEYHRKFADRRMGVVSARTYFYKGEEQCDNNLAIFKECIDGVSGSTKGTGMAAIKLTALGSPQLLLRVSKIQSDLRELFSKIAEPSSSSMDKTLQAAHLQDTYFREGLQRLGVNIESDDSSKWFTMMDQNKDGKINLNEWEGTFSSQVMLAQLLTVVDPSTMKSRPLLSQIDDDELYLMTKVLERVNDLTSYARDKGVRILIDAEQTYLQPAISRIAMELMRTFNREKAIVFNTYQCYLKEAHKNLYIDIMAARRENFYFGCKLVRGAYMEQERARAKDVGYPDPINETYELTTAMYNQCLDSVLEEMKHRPKPEVSVMIASHNEESIRYAVRRMQDYGIKLDDRVVCFAQLLGMCDQISFPLGQSGYSVYKYVPYGPLEDVMPYLSRRALENRGVIHKVEKEKSMIKKELLRRIKKFLTFR